MGYDVAIDKAWGHLEEFSPKTPFLVKFLADEYSIILKERKVLSVSCNVPAKDFIAILILHYLVCKIKGLPKISGQWQDFKELSAIEGYSSAFRKRAIEPIIRKYGSHPDNILSVLERFPGTRAKEGDISIVLDVFEQVPALIALWRPDEEFGPEANILFDKNITQIFCTEDIVVLASIIAAQL